MCTAGCGSPPVSPVSPLSRTIASTPGIPAPPAPPAPPAASTLASIGIEDAFAIGGPSWTCTSAGCQPGPGYLYEVRFLLHEGSGRSGAIVTTVVVTNPNVANGGTRSQES